jgi:putative transposase
MTNHFHLVVETPQPNLVAGMKWFLGTYTSRFNRRHKLSGHLFSGRYKAQLVDGSGNGYLKTVGDYVHVNPVRARIITPEQPLEEFRWSSYRLYLQQAAFRPAWLHVERLLGEWGIPNDTPAGRKHFAVQMEARRCGEANGELEPVRMDWCVGSDQFRRELLAQVSQKRGLWHYGPELQESAEDRAERVIERELQLSRRTEPDLLGRLKSDPFKVALARKLRPETTQTIGWIAKRLHMGTRGHLAQLLAQSDDAQLSECDQQQLNLQPH